MIQTMRSTLRNLIGLSLKNSLRWQFSASVERVQQILNKIQVESDGKTVNIIDSKIIVSHEVNSETNKVKLLLNLTKDYRQIKALLISALESEGFKDVEITLAPKSK